jgi:hypothetical protein
MIKQFIFTVTANTDVDDDVIFCNRLVFVGLHPQLVIRPKKGAPPGAQRLLKIVADTIDTQGASDPEITYNLADDFTYIEPVPGGPETQVPVLELPVGDCGLDPETQATPGRKGISDFEHFPLPPDVASPNFQNPLDPSTLLPGAYPKARDGGDGKPGARGKEGVNGINAPILEIWTKEIVGNKLTLDLRGQKGGQGGKGAIGQNGGNGELGSAYVPGTDSNWLGVPSVICVQGPGLGGDGGRGGDAGCGGDGGNGGNGGVVKVFYVSGVDLTKFVPMIEKGKGGNAGPAGSPGKGGNAGPAGFSLAPCTPALSSSGGPDGNNCPRGEGRQGGVARDGDDGLDGYVVMNMVTDIPRISWL